VGVRLGVGDGEGTVVAVGTGVRVGVGEEAGIVGARVAEGVLSWLGARAVGAGCRAQAEISTATTRRSAMRENRCKCAYSQRDGIINDRQRQNQDGWQYSIDRREGKNLSDEIVK